MTAVSSNKPSAAETAKKLKTLLQPLPHECHDAARLDELRRLFAAQDLSPSTSKSSMAVKKWKAHLTKQQSIFVSQLTNCMHRKTTVRTFWGVLAAMPCYSPMQHHPFCSPGLLQQFLGSIPSSVLSEDKVFRTMVESEFLQQYADVQYYAYIALAQLAEEQYGRRGSAKKGDKTEEEAADLLFQLLTMLPRIKSQDELDGATYLFPPPTSGQAEEEDSDDDEEEDSDEEDDGSDSEDEEESDSEEEDENPSKKRRIVPKKEIPKVFRYQQLKYYRKVTARAWLAILKLQLPSSALKRALQLLPTAVLPFIPNPLRFADFFVQAYATDTNSVVPILALDGLFYLLMDHNLEYPLFYTSLYRLVTPSLFHVKHRIRFFQLLIKCLTRNEMLPAHVVAAFLKRLLRSSLQAPPSGCLFALALSSNLLRKHEECASLIHKSGGSMEDNYNATTDDPSAAQALQSSLWELTVLEKHYYPAVATMAGSLGRMETKQTPFHDMDDFLVHTYKSLFDQERKRLDKKKKKVPLAFVKPTSLFVDTDVFAGMLEVKK